MTGETNLATLLSSMAPSMADEEYVFCTFPHESYGSLQEFNPIASFNEVEGLTLVIDKKMADSSGIHYDTTLRCITLSAHSSLDAVGLTAAVSNQLALQGISANVIAAYFHDHVFVPSHQAELAMEALNALTS